MTIRLLTPADAQVYWPVRLRALREHPEAFGQSYEEASQIPPEEAVRRFQTQWTKPDDDLIVGAFLGEALVGTTGFHRETHNKERHKGFIWGVYVAPEVRGRGIGRTLMLECLERCRQMPGLEQVNLSVVTENAEARTLYRSLGFEPYGLEPRALKLGDRYLDEEHMTRRLHASH